MRNMYPEGKDSEIEAEIRNLEEKECKAMLTGDSAVLKQVWAEDFMVNAPFNRVTLGSQEVIDLVKKGVIRYSSLTRTIEQVMVKQGIAITMGSEAAVPAGDLPKEGQTIHKRYEHTYTV